MSNNPIFSYTRRDYEGSRKEGLAKIPIMSRGKWTDLNATDPGIIILDYVHAIVDMMNYYQDHQAMESFLSTAKERENIFRLAKQLSYKIRSSKGATCNVTFNAYLIPRNHTVKIPKNTKLSTLEGISYLTSEDAYLLPGSFKVIVPCVQGSINTITYQGTGVSRFSNEIAASNQSLVLADENIDTESIEIVDNLGRKWESVECITFTGSADRSYQVELNPDNSVSIHFGDGERGVVPGKDDILTITYITNLAEEGRVPKNSVKNLDSTILDYEGKAVEFTVNNDQASIGGTSVQSSQDIKDLAPGFLKTQDRAVTLGDFENLAMMIEGVSHAKAYDININPDLCVYNEVKLLITSDVPEDSMNLLKNRVYEYISPRMIPPTNLQVITPSTHYVDIVISVKKLDIANEGRVSYEVERATKEYFKDRAYSTGEKFNPVELESVLSRLDDIRNLRIISPTNTVYVDELSIIKLGNITINFE